MLHHLESGHYDIAKNSNKPQICGSMVFNGQYSGLTLQFILLRMTKKKLVLGIGLPNVDYLKQVKQSNVDVYVPLFDLFTGETLDEQRAFSQFNVNAFKYEFIGKLNTINESANKSLCTYEVTVEVHKSQRVFWRV